MSAPAISQWCLQCLIDSSQHKAAVVMLAGDPWCMECANREFDPAVVACAIEQAGQKGLARFPAANSRPSPEPDDIHPEPKRAEKSKRAPSVDVNKASEPAEVTMKTPVKPETTQPDERRPCARTGCKKTVGPRSKSDYCASHYYLSKKKAADPISIRARETAPAASQHRAINAASMVNIALPIHLLDAWWQRLTAHNKAEAFSLFLQSATFVPDQST